MDARSAQCTMTRYGPLHPLGCLQRLQRLQRRKPAVCCSAPSPSTSTSRAGSTPLHARPQGPRAPIRLAEVEDPRRCGLDGGHAGARSISTARPCRWIPVQPRTQALAAAGARAPEDRRHHGTPACPGPTTRHAGRSEAASRRRCLDRWMRPAESGEARGANMDDAAKGH
jgi:hypothetical protein